MSRLSTGLVLLAASALLAAAPSARADEPSRDSPRPIRVRVEWGSETPLTWNGLVEVSQGRFDQPASLGVEADEPGTIWIEGGAVWFQRRSPRIYDGFDVSVFAPPDATLNVTLQSAGDNPIREQFTVKIAEIGARAKTIRSEPENLRLVLRRTPGDNLAVHVDRPHLIFAPHEQFHATVSLEPPPANSGNANCELMWQLCPARSERVLSRQSLAVEFGRESAPQHLVPVTVPLPHDEGAYDVHLIESHNGRETNRRSVQLLVLAEKSPRPRSGNGAKPAAELVDSFRPGNGHLFRHVTAKSNRKAIGEAFSNLLSFVPAFARTSETNESGQAGEKVQWDAYKLRVRHPGRPHRLAVIANATRAQSLGISLLEPNAAGQLMPVGLDSGLYIREADSSPTSTADSPSAATETHELVIWPKVRDPIVLLHDMGSGTPLNVERVELYEFESLPRAAARADSPPGDAPRRLVGPYLHAPLLPESFGAGEALDAESGRSLDDWTTFHTAATRSADYLHHAGYNSLMVAVLADGSTIYPSALLQPTPRYDTGVFFSSGQDPLRKDVLELMFRIFDRENLTLVPLAQFSTPLPVLERAITDDASRAVGIELVGRDGRSWRETHRSNRGLAPYYNPLNAQVQQAIIDVVAELADRYHAHASFAGLAVELGSAGYLQLPAVEWGLDDETVARFEKAAGVQVPGGSGNDRFQKRCDALTTTYAAQWNRWRCEELARFHRRLADTVTARKPDAQFILAGKDLLNAINAYDDVDEALRTGQKLEKLVAAKGLDFNLYADAPNITVLRPAQWRAPDRPLILALDETLNYSANLKSLFSNCRQGSLFYYLPRECRIAEFDQVAPWQPAYTWLASQASVAGVENRKRFAQALAAGDAQMIFDGGWLLPMGQEQTTLRTRQIIGQLPAVPFHLGKSQCQPVTVRIARLAGATWIYAVNDVPEVVDVHLNLSCAVHVAGRVLPNDESLSLAPPGPEQAGCSAQFRLEPYDVWASRLNDGTVNVETVHITMPESSKGAIAARIKKFDERLALMRDEAQTEKTAVANSGFEQQPDNDGTLPGWELPVQNAARWSLDETNPRSGNSSLMLTAAEDNLAALSSPLPLSEARLLTVSAWLRSDQDAADVRLVFAATVAGQPHVRHVPAKVDREWRHYVFRVTDIPAEKLDAGTVRIEMRGPGKLWIDDVDIRRSRLSPEDLRQLSKVYSAVTIAWDEARYADCERLLDGYWGQLPFDEPAPSAKPARDLSRTAEGLRRLFRRQ